MLSRASGSQFSVWLIAYCLSLIALLPLSADERGEENATHSAVLKAAAALYEGIRTETLPNGLRIYLKPVPSSPVVSTMVAYKVGSSDEDVDNTGLSHYLEHLMFKGTDKIMPGDIDRLTLRNGGANNAYTSEDYTVYHFDFAADRWEPALEIEAERMRHLRIDARHEFEQEKGAVISELERNEDVPWDLEQKTILPLLFGKNGPYGHPVIGERQHVRGATAAIIKAHYDKWYHPNNAALVISGGVDPDKALAKIKELFGPIPRGDLPERKPVSAIKHEAPLLLEIPSKFEVPRMLMGFNTVRIGEPDYYPLQVIQSLLAGGKTSRLYKKLVEGEEVASSVGSSDGSGRYPGWFSVQVELLKGKNEKNAEKTVSNELKRLRQEAVSMAELDRAKRGLLASAIFDRESVHNLADTIARGVTTNDLDFVKTYLQRIDGVTVRDVQVTAKKYLDPERRVVVWSIPGKREGSGGAQKATGKISAPPRRTILRKSADAEFSLKDAKRVVLDNGLTLLLFENHRLPIVVAEARVGKVDLLEPAEKSGVAELVGRMLDEGTDRHTGPAIAELIENVGGSLDLNSRGGSVKVLTPDRHLGFSLFFECLGHSTFPKEPFSRERAKLLSEIEDLEQRPDAKAQLVYRSLVYGKHPLGRPRLGTLKTVEKLTQADCADFHRQTFVPNNTVVAIVGDFDSKHIVDEIKSLTRGWKRAMLRAAPIPPVEKPKGFVQKIITMPEAAQLHFYLGEPGIRRDDPDYHKLLVMDYVLGTGPGFTDRLSARLRDRQGLAYTVQANITQSANEETGLFTCYIGTPPQNFELVKASFLEELNRIRDESPTTAEVDDAKKYLLGRLPFQLTTNERIAGQLLTVERFHLGLDYLDHYRAAVAAVTPSDVQQVARKHLDPKHMVLVATGAIDANGKVLQKPAGPKTNPK